jgi:hypothetical protein
MKDEEDDNIIIQIMKTGAEDHPLDENAEDEGAEEIIKVDASKFEGGHFMIIPKKVMIP